MTWRVLPVRGHQLVQNRAYRPHPPISARALVGTHNSDIRAYRWALSSLTPRRILRDIAVAAGITPWTAEKRWPHLETILATTTAARLGPSVWRAVKLRTRINHTGRRLDLINFIDLHSGAL